MVPFSNLGVVPVDMAAQPASPCKDDGSSSAVTSDPMNSVTPDPVVMVPQDPVPCDVQVPRPVEKAYVSHSDVEKKRKQKISSCIQQLAVLLQLQDQIGKMVSCKEYCWGRGKQTK